MTNNSKHDFAAVLAAIDGGTIPRCGGLGCTRVATQHTGNELCPYDHACDAHAGTLYDGWWDLPHADTVRAALAGAKRAASADEIRAGDAGWRVYFRGAAHEVSFLDTFPKSARLGDTTATATTYAKTLEALRLATGGAILAPGEAEPVGRVDDVVRGPSITIRAHQPEAPPG